ncbi:MAG: DUF2314 domain-containing protein [Neomegalonema sp.]|nr:DUF2314 domain-containing protein [Neomegalonema sp.]
MKLQLFSRAHASALVAWVLAATLCGGAIAQSTYRDKSLSDAPIMHFSDKDPAMNDAMRRAHASLSVFQKLMAEDPKGVALVKVALPVPSRGTVYKWMLLVDWNGGNPKGRFLQGSPTLGIKAGDAYAAKSAQIVDWTFLERPLDSGKIHGDFTTRVMLTRDPGALGPDYPKRHQPLPKP